MDKKYNSMKNNKQRRLTTRAQHPQNSRKQSPTTLLLNTRKKSHEHSHTHRLTSHNQTDNTIN